MTRVKSASAQHVHSTYIHVHAVLFTSDFNSHSIPGHPLTISLNTLTMLCHAVPTYSNSTLPNWALPGRRPCTLVVWVPSSPSRRRWFEPHCGPCGFIWVPASSSGSCVMGHDGGTKVVGFFLLRPLALLSGLRFLSILSIPGARQFINATTGGENILIKMS